MDRQAPKMRVRQPRAPPMADQLADGIEIMHPRQLRAEAGIYREPRGTPEIGRRPLDLGIPHHPQRRGPVQPAVPPP